MGNSKLLPAGAAVLLVLSVVAGSTLVAAQTAAVTVETSPTDPNDAEATHTVVFTPSEGSTLVGSTFNDIRINYSADTPTADVSGVGQGTIERIGIDRGSDDVGTRIDDEATVTEVSGKSDGKDVRVQTNQELDIEPNDQVVVVLQKVQNPQNEGTAEVDVTVNTQSTADSATDTVSYEYNDAGVTFSDQETTGDAVTVDEVTLSEDGYVVILNETGKNPDEVRGATFLEAGTHEDVQVDIEPGVATQTELWAQVHLDTNGDRRFDYSSSDGEVDGPFEDRNDDEQASESATVWQADRTQTPAPSDGDDAPEISNYEVTADGNEITVSFDSDETLTEIEVDVRGAEDDTLDSEDFSGDRFAGYEATYEADTDGEYTLELVTARDSSNNDGAAGEEYTGSVTVDTGDDESTPTDADTSTATPTDVDDTDTATATPTDGVETASPTDPATGSTQTGNVTDEETTGGGSPTDDDGAGFGSVVALAALLASALLFYRRR